MSVEKLRLKENHTWKSRPGYSICVLDRGLVRFDYPGHWIVKPDESAVHLHDQQPSVESCDLGVSLFHLSAEEIGDLSLDEVLRASLGGDRTPYQESAVHRISRPGLEIVWLEQRYTDEQYQRDARFRVALARGPALCLISMNYWANRAAGLERVWNEVLRTLVMGVPVADPTAGPVIQ